jgi:hypothetical protein
LGFCGCYRNLSGDWLGYGWFQGCKSRFGKPGEKPEKRVKFHGKHNLVGSVSFHA